MSQRRRRTLIALAPLALAAGLAAPAAAQLLPRLPLPNVGGVIGDVQSALPIQTPDLGGLTNLVDLRRLRIQTLIREHPREIDVDEQGDAVVRGEVLVVSPSPQSLEIARKLGFQIARQESLDGLDVTLVTLATPPGMNARQAVKRLRKADPSGQYDYDHIYTEAGAAGPSVEQSAGGSGGSSKVRIGLVDTGADATHPALAGLHIEQRGFAPGGVHPAAHGTATASLLAGRGGAFHGAAPGASLLVADVYGTGPTGGSAAAVVRGLAWMAQEHVPVVNVSLVGPPNASLEAVVKALSAQGTLIVAAVGNDGPAAPPLYPASYPQVVSVTGVDGRGRVLMEAGRAKHIDFAAPGADMAAANPDSRYGAVRGTSFASPIVAGKLAELIDGRGPGAAQAAVSALSRQAKDLGPKGPDKIYGHGLVGEDVRVSPKSLR